MAAKPRGKAAPAAKAKKPAKRTAPAVKEPIDCGLPQDLNPRHRAFVVEYLKDKHAGNAYKRAGYSAEGNAAEVNGARLLRNAQIQAELLRLEQQALAKVQNDTGITLERTLREIARIAYFDPRRMFDAKGRPLNVTELDNDTAAVVAGLDVLEEWEGSGQDRTLVGHVKKWKLADKKGALDMLMKHLGGYKEDNSQAGSALGKALATGLTVRFVEANK